MKSRDEDYILELCDRALGRISLRQYRFPFLVGDTGRRLPVDAYYPDLKLVIEYREHQHTEAVPFFDRRQTVSGIPRGQQRAIYDERRRTMLPQHGIQLIELNYFDFPHEARRRLKRTECEDIQVICSKLQRYAQQIIPPNLSRQAAPVR